MNSLQALFVLKNRKKVNTTKYMRKNLITAVHHSQIHTRGQTLEHFFRNYIP